jgi:hypothetical protein
MVKSSPDWIIQVKRLTTQLFQCLSKTVGAWENFCLNHATCFEKLSSHGERSLRDIEITFTELDSLRNELEYLAESCSEFAQEASFHYWLIIPPFIKAVLVQSY